MIEEIKKEISNLTTFNGGHNRMYISDFFKILDKYKEKECNYKKAWEELKQDCKEVEKDDDCVLFSRLEQLERIHGIEVE